ncbi:MAG: hypothetical protein ABI358_10990 [Ginsengibacter sp.]
MKAKLLFVLIILLACLCGAQINSYQKAIAMKLVFTLGYLGFGPVEKQQFKSFANKVVVSALTNRVGFLLFFNLIHPGAG